MQPNPETLLTLSNLLTQSLSAQPSIRHPAEKTLDQNETQQGFLSLVLTLLENDQVQMDVRLAAGVYFKNVVRKRWGEVSRLYLVLQP